MSGDPRRCPECGYQNPVGELELTAEAVARQLRGFENAPILCVTSVLFATPLILIAVTLNTGYIGPCVILSAVAAVGGWIVGAAIFYRFCLGRSGWMAALAKYHFYAPVVIAVFVAGYVGWQYLLRMMFGPFSARPMPMLYYLVTIAFTAGMIVAVRWLLPRVHRKYRADTLFLQREITIAIARDQIRNQMRRGPR